jgi:hypothetical protein
MFFVLVLMVLICIGATIWALTDIAATPKSAFVGVGMSKITWVVLIAGSLVVFPPAALILSVVYMSSVRPRISHYR